MLLALTADQFGVRVVAERLRQLVERDRDLERRQVRAGEEGVQVRGRETQAGTINNAHANESCVERG